MIINVFKNYRVFFEEQKNTQVQLDESDRR